MNKCKEHKNQLLNIQNKIPIQSDNIKSDASFMQIWAENEFNLLVVTINHYDNIKKIVDGYVPKIFQQNQLKTLISLHDETPVYQNVR